MLSPAWNMLYSASDSLRPSHYRDRLASRGRCSLCALYAVLVCVFFGWTLWTRLAQPSLVQLTFQSPSYDRYQQLVQEYPSLICECAATDSSAEFDAETNAGATAIVNGQSELVAVLKAQANHFAMCDALEQAATNVSLLLFQAGSPEHYLNATAPYRDALLKQQIFGALPLDALGTLLANASLSYTDSVPLDVFLRVGAAVCLRFWWLLVNVVNNGGTSNNGGTLIPESTYVAAVAWS
jgi:hypothetical protein